jgi:hypothetical protein
MNLPLLLLISFPLLLAIDPKKCGIKSLFTREDYDKKLIKSLFTKEEYDKIESSARLTFNPAQKCPCGKYYLGEMALAYSQWIHPETCKMQLARYLISKRLFASGRVGVVSRNLLTEWYFPFCYTHSKNKENHILRVI